MIRVGVVLQSHSVELTLVDVGHLVILSPHRTRGGSVQDVSEAEGRVDLGDLNLLGVGVAPPVVLPLPGDGIVKDVILAVLEAGVSIKSWSYLK